MRHHVHNKKLGRTTAHKKAMLRNMVTSLILNDRIQTTLPKAKELRKWADKMITLAKKNSLHAKRQAMSILRDRAAMQKLFTTLLERFKDRQGGYTRIMKLGFRQGDSAAMAIIEYLTAEAKKVQKGVQKAVQHAAPHAKSSAKKATSAAKKTVRPVEKKMAPVVKHVAKRKIEKKSREK